ncbi:homocysteine-responsive endoplasmic reticulum-resident ubiquitin-like domain member 2 protein [Prorops nasuta]|uniref:homocysteine-responsive endoplasmic reticulum-resident ubiquitin-like domain member 2 protein n=1 Tax=Prorops nasuta TaxID=863751 RepID=UPI0034CF994C
MMEGSCVNLIIKTPTQQIRDQIVKCDIEWTVGQLKDHLSEVYPNKPEKQAQKLIYSGRLLSDSTCLKDVLRHSDDFDEQFYIVHLVCASQKSSIQNLPMEDSDKIENFNMLSNSREASTSATASNVLPQPNQDNNEAHMEYMANQLPSQQLHFEPQNNQQMVWMQQAYSYYLTQYMQLMAAQGIQLQSTIPYVQQMNVNTTDSVPNAYVNNQDNNNNNVDDDLQQPGAQDQGEINVGNNHNALDDAAGFNRDWLDFFYMLSRIIVLFSIVYFYSSPLRFLIVTFLGFAMYLYQGGFFRVQQILLAENNNGRAENNQMIQNEAAGQAPPLQPNGQDPVVQPEARTNANEEPEEERPGALAFTWTFFSSFFASLIPEQPNVI